MFPFSASRATEGKNEEISSRLLRVSHRPPIARLERHKIASFLFLVVKRNFSDQKRADAVVYAHKLTMRTAPDSISPLITTEASGVSRHEDIRDHDQANAHLRVANRFKRNRRATVIAHRKDSSAKLRR